MKIFGEKWIDEHTWRTHNMCALKALEDFVSKTEDKSIRAMIKSLMRSIRRHALRLDSIKAQEAAMEKHRDFIYSKHEISIRQCQLFLVTGTNGNQILDDWKGLLLAVAYCHEAFFGGNERIQRALTAWRFMAGEQHKNDIKKILSDLPGPYGQLDSIVASLNELVKSRLTVLQKRRLLPIRRLIEDVHEKEIRRERQPKTEGETKDGAGGQTDSNHHQNPYAYHRVSGGNDIEGFTEFVAKTDAVAEYQNSVEFSEDHQSSRTFICAEMNAETPDWIAQSSALTAMQARNTVHQIERREKKLVTSWSGLTRFEVSSLVKGLQSSDRETTRIRLVLSIMLLSGRGLDQLSEGLRTGQLRLSPQTETWQWQFAPELPEHKLSKKFQALVNVQQHPVCLSLANLSCQSLSGMILDEAFRSEIEHWLSQLNHETGARLTINRVSDYLGYFLHHLGCDEVSIALITGDISLQQAGLYYYQFDANQLHRIHANFVSTVYGEDVQTGQNGRGGSQLLVESGVVAALLDHQSQLVEKARLARDLVEFHNAYTLFMLTVLNLATGHRPVKDPYDDLDSFDFLGRKIFISDKEVRNGDAYRTLVLPQGVVEQLEVYLQHLQALKEDLYFSDREVALSIQSTLDGKAPFFFFLGDQGTVERLSIQPKSLHQHLSPYFDLPFNWHRHYLRTHLSRWGVAGEVIDAFMGHAKPGQEALAQFSGMSIQSLKGVADLLGEKLAELGADVLPGWKQDV